MELYKILTQHFLFSGQQYAGIFINHTKLEGMVNIDCLLGRI